MNVQLGEPDRRAEVNEHQIVAPQADASGFEPTDGLARSDQIPTELLPPSGVGTAQQHSAQVARFQDEVEGVKWYRKAAEGGFVNALNAFAWVLATSGNSAIRDGSNAVVFAEKAVAATNRKDPPVLDTLAAAYAEAGQFEKAVKIQQEAIALLQTEAEKNDYGTRLKLYEARVPYRALEFGHSAG